MTDLPNDSERTEGEKRWNEAVDWLLNSSYTADPDIQKAFWGIVDGRCTCDEADKGQLPNGRAIPDEGEGRGCDGCGDLEKYVYEVSEGRYLCESCDPANDGI